eukprot:jgi/Tetstr1/447880/TSEL_035189.t1
MRNEDDVMGVGEDPVGEEGMDIDAPAWPPAGVEAADEGVIREGDPGDFYMKVIAKKFRGVWHYGVITGVVTEWVLDYGGATQWRAVFEDGDTVDLLRSEEEEEAAHLRAWESAAVPGSDTNALTFAVMKCSAHVKSKNSNNSADSDWQLLHDIMPAGFTWGGMAMPRSHKAMRKFLRVPDKSRYVRHMCPKGCVAFSGAPGKAGGWANLPDQHCPECNADRAALCTVWTLERAHTAMGFDLWRVPGGGGGSGGEEVLVLLDGPGIRKVAVLMAPAHMSSANAADLGVDAGELLVAGIQEVAGRRIIVALQGVPPCNGAVGGGRRRRGGVL